MTNTIYKVAQCFFPAGLQDVNEGLRTCALRAFILVGKCLVCEHGRRVESVHSSLKIDLVDFVQLVDAVLLHPRLNDLCSTKRADTGYYYHHFEKSMHMNEVALGGTLICIVRWVRQCLR